jgi:hypothetical protein
MMGPRWLALPLAALTGCASMSGAPAPRLLSPDLHLGTLDQRTDFELDDRGSAPAAERDAPDDRVDTPKKERRRKALYFTSLGAIGFGVLGTLGFGVGGRIVQGQMKNGYEDGTLTHDREDQLSTTGKVMNGLAIGSAVVGLLGVITAATVYGIDHARCGNLPPRRKKCEDRDEPEGKAAAPPAPQDAGASEAPAGPTTESPSGPTTEPPPGPTTESPSGPTPPPSGPTSPPAAATPPAGATTGPATPKGG